MNLPAEDRGKIRRVIELGHALESLTCLDMPDHSTLGLKKAVADCADSEDPGVQRLADLARLFKSSFGARELQALLVPFERLARRAVRDDEFLISTSDQHPSTPPKTVDPASTVSIGVILDNWRSAFNVGAVFRTAECLAARHVYLCGYTPTPSDVKTARTSMGTAEVVSWSSHARLADAIRAARGAGFEIVALETAENSCSLYESKFTGPTAFVLGNERFGLDAEHLRLCDRVCRIPVFGAKNSLNAAISFSIAGYEWRRQLVERSR